MLVGLLSAKWALLIPAAITVAQPHAADQPSSRIVHRFDFNEPNYYDDVPRGWLRFPDRQTPDPSFPRYTDGRFDRQVGHAAAPSFHLASDGRSVAYRYTGGETQVRPGDYVVHGWIKPDNLASARAALSAYYLDWEGRYVPGTQRFSQLIGGAGDDAWTAVSVLLPPAPATAHSVGLTCWVVQDEVWQSPVAGHRHIAWRDVRGGAWFDDIVVQGRPRATLNSAHAGNVVLVGEPLRLHTVVADEETGGLVAELEIAERSGAIIARRGVPVHEFEDARTTETLVRDLPPGLYHALLRVRSQGEVIVERQLTFGVLGRRHSPQEQVAQHVGVMLAQAPVAASGGERPASRNMVDTAALIDELGVGAVKLPIWTADSASAFDAHPDELHDLLDRLIGSRVDVIGVFGGAPTSISRADGAFAPTLLDTLSMDERAWRGPLEAIVAPYASIFAGWQLGCENETALFTDSRTPGVLSALRQAMSTLLPAPNLATVASAGDWPGAHRLAVENLSITLPADIHPNQIAAHVAPFAKLGHDQIWLALPDAEVTSDAELIAWVQRLVAARQTTVQRVFAPAPWRVQDTEQGIIHEPTAAFLALRTVVDQLGDDRHVADFALEPAGVARAFGDGRHATIVAWNPEAPAEGTLTTLQLGRADHGVDMWGREFPIERDAAGTCTLRLTSAPVFIPDVEQWLVAFRAGAELRPGRTALAVAPQRHTLVIANPRDVALSGEVVFDVEAPWEVAPNRLRFAIAAGETQEFPLLIRQPPNATAGIQTFTAQVQFTSDPPYRLDIPLQLELGLEDVDVWGYALNKGNDVLIRHGVTSRATRPVSFRAFAVVPGRSRQYRTINELLPGQSLTIEYLFKNASAASGRDVRLGLREVNGPRLHNLEIQVP